MKFPAIPTLNRWLATWPDGRDCGLEAIERFLQITLMEVNEVLYVDAIGPRGDIYKS